MIRLHHRIFFINFLNKVIVFGEILCPSCSRICESKLHLFREDLQNLKNKLDQNALVCFYIAEWQEIITKLQKYSPEIFEIVVEETGAIFDLYPPRDIRSL